MQDLASRRVHGHTRSPRNHAFAFRAGIRPLHRGRRTVISAGQPTRATRSRRCATPRGCVARYYDPTTGQFLTRDLLVASTRSAYGYTAGNPLNSIDPTGLSSSGGNAPPGMHWSALTNCFHPNSERLQIGPGIFRPSNWFSMTWPEKKHWIWTHDTHRIQLVKVDQGGVNYSGELCWYLCLQGTISLDGDGINASWSTGGFSAVPGGSISATATTRDACHRNDTHLVVAGGAGLGVVVSSGIKTTGPNAGGELDLYDNEAGASITSPGVQIGPMTTQGSTC